MLRRSARAISMASAGVLLVLAGAGPGLALETKEASAVKKCQAAVNSGSQTFLKAKVKYLNTCAQAIANASLGEITGSVVLSVTSKCEQAYSSIHAASTTFVNKVLSTCGPASHLVLGPDSEDPLGFQALLDVAIAELPPELAPTNDLAGLTALLCGTVDGVAEISSGAALPLGVGAMLQLLGTPPLDGRCLDLGLADLVVDLGSGGDGGGGSGGGCC
jgi:hypothetical protein